MPGLRARVLLILTLSAALAATAPARAATQVSYPQLLEQIKSGPLIRAVINRRGGDIEIKFRNLSEWKAFYPPGAQPYLQSLLHKRHIRVIFAARHAHAKAKPAAVHHHLRYIAAGVLGALLVCGGAFWLLRRRRGGAPVRGDAATS
jgi:hypothetical protein